MADSGNRQILLTELPKGKLHEDCFELVDGERPVAGPGELLVRTIIISTDAANRAWMRGRTYRDRLSGGEVMSALGLCEVVDAGDSGIAPGTIVFGECGWQEWATMPAAAALPIAVHGPLTDHAGTTGATGVTGYHGLLEIGQPKPGETLLVSAAAGATGNVVGQIGKIKGMRVVGVAGSDAKLAFLTDELGFDAAVSHRSDTFADDLRAACPDGIDVYFDNVGGAVLDAALAQMNDRGRIVCCGLISSYDEGFARPADGVPWLIVSKRLRMEGFIVLDFMDKWEQASAELAGWVKDGKLKVLVDVFDGLESAPRALVGLLAGDNIGKRCVRVAPDPA